MAGERIVIQERWLFPLAVPLDEEVRPLYFATIKVDLDGVLRPIAAVDRVHGVAYFPIQK